jgi:hypothetical protein
VSCDVQLETVDMLSVGMSLRMLARALKTPHGTREIYARVGAQMVAAAQRSMAEQIVAAKGEPRGQ